MNEKKSRRAAQLSPEERREQLLRCAVTAFAHNGIGRATHAQVAKIAGVAVPTVFTYFPTRESLVDGVFGEVEKALLGIVGAEIHDQSLTAFQKLLNLLTKYLDSIDHDPDMVKVFLDWTTSFEESLASKFRAYLDKLVPLLAVIIDEGRKRNEFGPEVNAVDAALMIYSSANVLAQIRFYKIEVDARHYIINLIASVLHLNLDEDGIDGDANSKNQQAYSQWSNFAPSNGQFSSPAESSKRRSSKSKWQSHIRQWKASGLSQLEYCRQYDLKPSTFSYWVKKQ